MQEQIVIKGGSKIYDSARVEDSAHLELHAVLRDQAVAKGKSVVARSTVAEKAVIEGTAHVKDAYIGGNANLNIECIGKNGHITSNSHMVYIKIFGQGYTVHRIYSEAKGYSAQIMHENGTKMTIGTLKELADEHPEFKVLQYLFNQCKKIFSETIE